MTEQELQDFADNYTTADFEKIKFDWNGKHADCFHDNNYDFRMELCEFIIQHLDRVKLELIRDLYIELSKWANEAWCVYNNYHLFAQELLNRGGITYVVDYLNGSIQCFDTILASRMVKLSQEQKQTFYNFIIDSLQTEKDERTIKLLQFGKDRFQPSLNVN